MSCGICAKRKKRDFETDLRGVMQVCQKVEVVRNVLLIKNTAINCNFKLYKREGFETVSSFV